MVIVIFAGCDGPSRISNQRYASINGTGLNIISEKNQKLYREEFSFSLGENGIQLTPKYGASAKYTTNGNSLFLEEPFRGNSESNLIIMSSDLNTIRTSSSEFSAFNEISDNNFHKSVDLAGSAVTNTLALENYLRALTEKSLKTESSKAERLLLKDVQIMTNGNNLNFISYFDSANQDKGFYHSINLKRIENIPGIYYLSDSGELDFLSIYYQENSLSITIYPSNNNYIRQYIEKIELKDNAGSEVNNQEYISFPDWINLYRTEIGSKKDVSKNGEVDEILDKDPQNEIGQELESLLNANELVSNYREYYSGFRKFEQELAPQFGPHFKSTAIKITDPDIISKLKLIHDYAWPHENFNANADLENALLITTSYIKEFQNDMSDEVYSLFVATAQNILVEMGNYTAALKLINVLPKEYLEKNRNLSLAAGQIKADLLFAEGEWEEYISQVFKIVVDNGRMDETYFRLAKAANSTPNRDISRIKYWEMQGSFLKSHNMALGDVSYLDFLIETDLYQILENIELYANLLIRQQEDRNTNIVKILIERGISEQAPLSLEEQKDLERLARLKDLVRNYDPDKVIRNIQSTENYSFNLDNHSAWEWSVIEERAPKYPSLYSRSGIHGSFDVKFDVTRNGEVDINSIEIVSYSLFQAEKRVSGPTRFFESEIKNALKKFKFEENFFRGERYPRHGVIYKFNFEL